MRSQEGKQLKEPVKSKGKESLPDAHWDRTLLDADCFEAGRLPPGPWPVARIFFGAGAPTG